MMGLAPAFPVKESIMSRMMITVFLSSVSPSHSPSFLSALQSQPKFHTHTSRPSVKRIIWYHEGREAGLWSHVRGWPVDYTATRTFIGLLIGRLGDFGELASSCPALWRSSWLEPGKCQHSIVVSSCKDEYIERREK